MIQTFERVKFWTGLQFIELELNNGKILEKDIEYFQDVYWLWDCEFENANITISGEFLVWKNGIWKNGIFESSSWENGIWENGEFQARLWKNGEFRSGVFEGSVWEDGTWINDKSTFSEKSRWKKGLIKRNINDNDPVLSYTPPNEDFFKTFQQISSELKTNQFQTPKEIRGIKDPTLYSIADRLLKI